MTYKAAMAPIFRSKMFSERRYSILIAVTAASPALLPTAPGVIIITLAFLITLLLPAFWRNVKELLATPATYLPLCLFALLLASAFWSDSSWQESLRYLKKYKEFVLIPVLVFAMSQGNTRKYAMWSLYWSLSLSALTSLLIYLDWLEFPHLKWWEYTLYSRIFFGISTAFLAYWAYQLALRTSGRERWLHITVILLSLVGILLIARGRTGYVVLAALAILEVTKRRRALTKTLVIAGTALLFCAAYFVSDHFRTRIDHSVVDVQQYFANNNNQTSIGIRLDLYKYTLKMIAENPAFGSGIGDFADDYERLTPEIQTEEIKNPHNEYLMLAASAGVPAALLFLVWLFVLARHAWRHQHSQMDGTLLLGAVITTTVSCLFNSSILDSRDGAFFLLLIAVFLHHPKQVFETALSRNQNHNKSSPPDSAIEHGAALEGNLPAIFIEATPENKKLDTV